MEDCIELVSLSIYLSIYLSTVQINITATLEMNNM